MDIIDKELVMLSPTYCGDFKCDFASPNNSTASITRQSTSITDDDNDAVNEVNYRTIDSDTDEDDELLPVEFEIPSPSLVSYMKANSVYNSTSSLSEYTEDDDGNDGSMSVHLSWGVGLLNELSERDAELEAVETAYATCAEKLALAEKDLGEAEQAREKAGVAKSELAMLQAQLATTETNLIEKINETGRLTDEVKEAKNQFAEEAAKGRQLTEENQRLREDLDRSDCVNSALTELQKNTSAWLEEELKGNLSLEGSIKISIKEEALHSEESELSHRTNASPSKGFKIRHVLIFCSALGVVSFSISPHLTDNGSISSKKSGVFDDSSRTVKNERIRFLSSNSELIPMIMEWI